MLVPIKYFNINWVDGMKLSSKHFVEQENAFIDHLRDVSAINLTSYNYGLLDAVSGNAKSLSHSIEIDKNLLVRVYCERSPCKVLAPIFIPGRLRITILWMSRQGECSTRPTDQLSFLVCRRRPRGWKLLAAT